MIRLEPDSRAPQHRGTIVFSHANGFPALTYRVLFDAWRAAGYAVAAIEKFGHDPEHPVSRNWNHLERQLVATAEQAAGGAPVHLVGHSLGGFLSLMAACRRPQLAATVVMLDSPIVTGWRAHLLGLAKRSGAIRRFSPGRLTHKRRDRFPDQRSALAHFAGRGIFRGWDEQVLHDYIRAGISPVAPAPTAAAPAAGSEAPAMLQTGEVSSATADAFELSFRRDIETYLYNTLPHEWGRWLRQSRPPCPIWFLAGTRSAELRQFGPGASRAMAGDRFVWVDGTHLFPMERPRDSARLVLDAIEAPAGTTGAALEPLALDPQRVRLQDGDRPRR